MKDYCKNCPLYWSSCDYWGEWDEGCYIGLDGWFDGKDHRWICKMPTFIKKLYLTFWLWKEERYWRKHIKQYEKENEYDGE